MSYDKIIYPKIIKESKYDKNAFFAAIVRYGLVIITGTWLGSELFDRPVAYYLRKKLLEKGVFAVVLSHSFLLRPPYHDIKKHPPLHLAELQCKCFYKDVEEGEYICMTDFLKNLIEIGTIFISIGNHFSNEFSKIVSFYNFKKSDVRREKYVGRVTYKPCDASLNKEVTVWLAYGSDPIETLLNAKKLAKEHLEEIVQEHKKIKETPEYDVINFLY